MPPAADHAVVLILGKPARAEACLEVMKGGAGGDLDDNVDVLCGPDRWGAGVGDPQRHGGAADEDEVFEQLAERVGSKLEKLDAHPAADA